MKDRNFKSASSVAVAVALSFAVRGAFAGSSAAYTGGTYTQDFNSLYTPSVGPVLNLEDVGSLVQIGPQTVGSSPIDLTGPSNDGPPATIAALSSMTGWYATSFGGNSNPLNYNVNDGSSSSVALTAYYNPNDPKNQVGTSPNLALGALSASGSGNVVYGVRLVNNSNTTYNAISLSYTGELFHQDLNTKTLTFGYQIDPTGTADIPLANNTSFGALDVGGFTAGAASATFQTKNLSVTNLTLTSNWAPGQAIWLTWQSGVGGGGQGLAIDDLSFSASHQASAPVLTWAHVGSGNWNTSDTNWSGSSTIFANGNDVVFGSSASNSTISVDPAGVTAHASVTVNSPNATTYTFTGGPIGGSAVAFIVSGNGTVQFTAPNTYGLGTNITGGTLIVDNNNELGASAAALNLQGGTLKLAADFTGANRSLVVSSAGGTINLGGFNASFGASSGSTPVIHGNLTVTGGGNLNLGIQPGFGNSANPAGALIIDSGSNVTLVGNGRGSATDMYAGGVFNGNLILNTTAAGARFNFDSVGANSNSKITGTGKIIIMNGSQWHDTTSVTVAGQTVNAWSFNSNTSGVGGSTGEGVIISNTSGQFAGEIDADIYINPLADSDPVGHPFTPLNVATANFTGTVNPNSNSFGLVLGATKKGTAGHGTTFSNMVIYGNITGHADINLGNDYASGGSGDVTLMSTHNDWHGATMINGGGALYIGVPDALPTDTDIVFGSFSGAGAGSVDLSGHNQHVQSIEVGAASNAPQANVINNSGAANATLFITGNVTPFYPFDAQLNDGGQAADGSNGTHTLALAKTGSSTLVLGEYQYAGSESNSSYTGGTTISGGTIQIGFDGALGGAAGSLTLDGGTLSVQNPQFIGDATGAESTVSFSSSRLITVTSNGGTILNPSFQATLQVSNATVTLVEPMTLTGNGGYNWGGKLQYSGAANSSLTINGGTGAVSLSGVPAVQANAGSNVFVGGSTDPFTDSADNTKHVAIVSNGLVDFTTGAKAVAGISGTGTVQVDAGATLTSDGAKVGTLVVNGTHIIRANATSAGTSLVSSLTIAGSTGNWTGHLDLSGTKLVVEAAVSKPAVIATLQNQAAYGVTHTAGITSTGMPANFGLAVMDNAVLGKTSFGGVAVDSSSVLVSQELLGDSNADGHVDLTDLSTVLNNFGTATLAWTSGNFDGASTIDLTDLSAVLNNFGLSNPSASSETASGGATPATAVPEPTSLALMGIGAVALLRRRKQI
ncbi:MAG TPA: PEP-CTERM sorting domain-containing protein [Phycisphaerae bacterium]|nr:PEP-CTERM sorting domain-containing protein [Phycisphaerae bacterium]